MAFLVVFCRQLKLVDTTQTQTIYDPYLQSSFTFPFLVCFSLCPYFIRILLTSALRAMVKEH
jgi:hypothetical protein